MKMIASLAALMAAVPACVQSVRGETTDPAAVLANLQKAVHDMRDEHEAALKAKADDVVTNEKIERINSAVSDLQGSIDDLARKAAAADLNGNGRQVQDPEYSAAFAAYAKDGAIHASLNKSTGADGGFLAPSEWDRTITEKLVEVSPMRSLASVQTIGEAAFKKLFNLRGMTSGWVGETAARPETATPTFGELEYKPGEIYANAFATTQMLEDAQFNLEAFIADEASTEFAKQEGAAFVSGTGVNRPNGFLNFVDGGSAAGVHPLGNIPVVNSGGAAALTADGIIKLAYDLPSSFRNGAGFVMNRATEGLVRLMKDTTNQYLWQPSFAAGTPATLAGYPVTELPDMPNVAANALAIAFGNFQRGYLIVDRAGVGILRDPYTNKPYIGFYATKRVGGQVLNPEALRIQRVAA